jgi:hypothetical protein
LTIFTKSRDRSIGGGLDLHKVHVMHHASITPDMAIGRKHVVDRRFAHLFHDRQRSSISLSFSA